MPEKATRPLNVELTGGVRDIAIDRPSGELGRHVTLSKCWQSVHGTGWAGTLSLQERHQTFDRSEHHTCGAKILLLTAIPALQEPKCDRFKSSVVAQATYDLELLACGSFGWHSPGHFAVVTASSRQFSGVTFSLRRDLECVVRWTVAGIASHDAIRSFFLLLLLTSDLLVSG